MALREVAERQLQRQLLVAVTLPALKDIQQSWDIWSHLAIMCSGTWELCSVVAISFSYLRESLREANFIRVIDYMDFVYVRIVIKFVTALYAVVKRGRL